MIESTNISYGLYMIVFIIDTLLESDNKLRRIFSDRISNVNGGLSTKLWKTNFFFFLLIVRVYCYEGWCPQIFIGTTLLFDCNTRGYVTFVYYLWLFRK